MIAQHWLWGSMSWPELAEALDNNALAILPMGATEQHGPHLPLATDTIIAEGILSEALELLESDTPILVLPTISVGHSPEHLSIAGTLSIDANKALNSWRQIAESAFNAGLKRLVIFNAHGGQKALCDILAQQLRCEYEARVITCHSDDLGLPPQLFRDGEISHDEQRIGIHAGQIETSLMLVLAPTLVQMALSENFSSSREKLTGANEALRSGGCARYAWLAEELNALGAVGNAAAANEAIGAKILEHRAAKLARVLEESIALPLV